MDSEDNISQTRSYGINSFPMLPALSSGFVLVILQLNTLECRRLRGVLGGMTYFPPESCNSYRQKKIKWESRFDTSFL
jgi:hypothetical protein